MTARSVAIAALVAAVEVTAIDPPYEIPKDLSTRPLLPDVYGYSIEPVWVNDYISTPMMATLMSNIANVTGKPPPIRIGGNTADQTHFYQTLSTGNDSAAWPAPATAKVFNVTPSWYESWANYFPQGTDIIYTLNLAVNDSAWANAVAEAEAVHAALGDKLVMFELGNEIDHFINKGWRDASWDVAAYTDQFRNVTGQIVASDWYKAAASPPKIQAGVFGDPPSVPDQQDEVDDFTIVNLTQDGDGGLAARPEDKALIGSYATHLYPQSTCDSTRWMRMRLDLLSDHSVLWQGEWFAPRKRARAFNVSQYIPHVAAAEKAGAPLVMGETNSVSCSGRSGISDVFGAALWGVDYVLTGASIGIQKTYFHLGAQSEYSAFTPKAYEYKGEALAGGIRANWYGHYFVAKVAAAKPGEALSIAGLPSANSSSMSGFAVYADKDQQRTLAKLVFVDMGVWNGTFGLSNNSTLKVTDGTFFDSGLRPANLRRVATPWCRQTGITVTRLGAPGTNAKQGVKVAGVAFSPTTGDKLGDDSPELLTVGEDGVLLFALAQAEAVVMEVAPGNNGSNCTTTGNSAAGGKAVTLWTGLLAAGLTGLFTMGLLM
ncbi:glycoside hydrolase family 79 protein [Hypoxylon sp. NC1633]|nr:glycoside hydrolase family 79 protein [Hypoxylon sp. NC1633]